MTLTGSNVIACSQSPTAVPEKQNCFSFLQVISQVSLSSDGNLVPRVFPLKMRGPPLPISKGKTGPGNEVVPIAVIQLFTETIRLLLRVLEQLRELKNMVTRNQLNEH